MRQATPSSVKNASPAARMGRPAHPSPQAASCPKDATCPMVAPPCLQRPEIGTRHAGLWSRGGATVEHAVVFPLVLLIVGLVLQLAVLAHDRAVLRAVVSGTATELAEAWTDVGVAASFSKDSGMEPDMYWQVRTLLGAGSGAERLMAERLADALRRRRWMSGSGMGTFDADAIEVRIDCKGGLPFAVLRVSASVPVGGLASGWSRLAGSKHALRIRAGAEVLVLAPRTVIQDLDQGLLLLQGVDAVQRVASLTGKLGKSLGLVAERSGMRPAEE